MLFAVLLIAGISIFHSASPVIINLRWEFASAAIQQLLIIQSHLNIFSMKKPPLKGYYLLEIQLPLVRYMKFISRSTCRASNGFMVAVALLASVDLNTRVPWALSDLTTNSRTFLLICRSTGNLELNIVSDINFEPAAIGFSRKVHIWQVRIICDLVRWTLRANQHIWYTLGFRQFFSQIPAWFYAGI